MELALSMYRKYIEKLGFFQNKNGHFIAYVCPLLKPVYALSEEIIYREGEQVNGIYFLLSGKIGFILNQIQKNDVYMYVEEGHYFGEIDYLSYTLIDNQAAQQAAFSDNKRKFTTISMVKSDLLLWPKPQSPIEEGDTTYDVAFRSLW